MDVIQSAMDKHKKHETDLQAETGLPVFETLVILAIVKNKPELDKRSVSFLAREKMGANSHEDPKYLKFIDNMMRVGLICKHDFRYHMTPNGERYLKETLTKIAPALSSLMFL